MRLDLDVEVNEQGQVDEFHDLRLERSVTTIKELLDFGAVKIILCGHRGRPQAGYNQDLSLSPVKSRLEFLLNKLGVQEKINLINDVSALPESAPGRLVMLENLRFWPGEKNNDRNFALELGRWGEVYVNDAFGNSHRSDASMLAIAKILPAYAGLSLINEIKELTRWLDNLPRPYAAILGGAKIETKIPLIKQLLTRADAILIGGALANTMLAARGINVGQSLVEEEYFSIAKTFTDAKIFLPIDAVLSDGSVSDINSVDSEDFIGDIGPRTAALFKQKIAAARAILWNGPMGKFEDARYQAGTRDIVAAITQSQAKTVSGGGDTLDVLTKLNVIDKFSFVSVGGGAMLTFLAGESMPGLEALVIHTSH